MPTHTLEVLNHLTIISREIIGLLQKYSLSTNSLKFILTMRNYESRTRNWTVLEILVHRLQNLVTPRILARPNCPTINIFMNRPKISYSTSKKSSYKKALVTNLMSLNSRGL